MHDSDMEQPTFWERHQYSLFLIIAFVVIFTAARVVIVPMNNAADYNYYLGGLKSVLRGGSPFTAQGYVMPPWSVLFLLPHRSSTC